MGSALVFLHITAGAFGLGAGGTALLAPKGAALHRTAGSVFFVAMLVMAASGIALAHLTPAAPVFNSIIGTLTLYLVATSWVTVVRKAGETSVFEIVALVAALAAGTTGIAFGLDAATRGQGDAAAFYFVFGGIALLAAAADASVIARGGVSGAQRIARHLWRMCFALLIGSIAFFIGQGAKVFPAWLRETQLLAAPVILVAVLMVFWLGRVLANRRAWADEKVATDAS